MFSVPKAILFCPSAAVHVGQWGCHGGSSRDRGCSLTGNLISELSEKNSLCFIKDHSKHWSLDFPFQGQYEKRNTYFFVQKEFLFALPLTFPSPSTSAFHWVLHFSFYLSGDKGDFLGRSHSAPSSGPVRRGKAKHKWSFGRSSHYPETFSNSETRESTQTSEL